MRKVTLAFVLLSLAMNLYAKDKESKKSNDHEEMLSQDHRPNQRNSIQFGLFGTRGGATEQGLRYEYFLGPNRQISASYLTFSGEIDETEEINLSGATFKIISKVKGHGVSFGYKEFFGNSVYFRGELDHVTMSADIAFKAEFQSTSSTEDIASVGEFRKASMGVAVGNQWTWENFTLGCDWFGFSIPLWKDSDIKSDFSDLKFTALGEENTFVALRFYLGYSW
mgnify:CR=1 FL=1